MLMIYRHETRLKTGYVVTEDIIAPGKDGRYKPAKANHPEAQKAQTVMSAMGSYFHSTARDRRIPLKEAFEGACKLQPEIAQYAKYLSATPAARERILVK